MIKKIVAIIFLCLLFPLVVFAQSKKGVGLAESQGLTEQHLFLLNAAWYYNWGYQSKLKTNIEFIPMLFSANNLNKLSASQTLLAFNEPDNSKQANMTVEEALQSWEDVIKSARMIGSPAMAGNPVRENSWLKNFMDKKPKVDFMTYHWYKGSDPDKFIKDIKELIKTFGLPVWVTEFAPQTVADAKQNPNKYSAQEVAFFMQKVTQWMNQEPMVLRYAWHDAKTGTSALFNEKLELTDTGLVYAKIK